MKPRLFIGSSSEGRAYANALQALLEHECEPTVWSQGVFKLSDTTIESLEQALAEYDFAAFVFSPDDITQIRQIAYQSVRDNVIFELGMFIGRIGRKRIFIIKPRHIDNFRLPTDLLSVTASEFDASRRDKNWQAALGPTAEKILSIIQQLGYKPIDNAPVQVRQLQESYNTASNQPHRFNIYQRELLKKSREKLTQVRDTNSPLPFLPATRAFLLRSAQNDLQQAGVNTHVMDFDRITEMDAISCILATREIIDIIDALLKEDNEEG